MKPILPLAALLPVLVACSGSPPRNDVLANRLSTSLAIGETCNSQARVERTPDGARVRIPGAALFSAGQADLTGCGQYTLASVTEAMLDPAIMELAIEPETAVDVRDPAFPGSLPQRRAVAVASWFSEVAYLPMQRPVLVVSDPGAAASGNDLGLLVRTVGYRSRPAEQY